MHHQFARGSYRHALRLLLAPDRLLESLSAQHPPALRNSAIVGAQAGLTVFIAAALLHFTPWQHVLGYAGLGALATLFGRSLPTPQRQRIVSIAGALLLGPMTILSWLSWLGLPTWALLLALSMLSGVIASLSHRLQTGAPGAVIFIFAASAALHPVDDGLLVLQRSGATALGVFTAIVLCRLTDHLRSVVATPSPLQNLSHQVLATPHPGYAVRPALRMAVCAALASGLAYVAGWSHPAWAAIGAVAVQQGVHLPGTAHRAWQRTLGTMVGAGIAWALLSSSPSLWTLLLAVLLLQICTEVTMGYNYALGQVFVTPMALLMTTLAMPGEATEMAVSRVFDTTLGAGVGIVLAWAFSSLDERIYLAHHHLRSKKTGDLRA